MIFSCSSTPTHTNISTETQSASVSEAAPQSPAPELKVGAERLDSYMALLKNKRVALVVNHTAMVAQTHLLDTLLSLGIQVQKILAPEHGFRGTADAGEHVDSYTDKKTGVPVVSLYGNNKKPSAEQLADIDIVVYDIQDVGVRFFTYISTLYLVMESCAENNKELLVLDRPNPNGDYVDGPVLDMKLKSFVGMLPLPTVHGLTVGELTRMIQGEKWLKDSLVCKYTVIPVENYTHKTEYILPIKPSPNMPNSQAIRLYPSLGVFEGTNVSVGRGTYFPFQVIGSPFTTDTSFSFTPVSIVGMSKDPMHMNKKCYGFDLRNITPAKKVDLSYVINMYALSSDKVGYFGKNNFFDKLAGTTQLKQQIIEKKSEDEIRKTWAAGLQVYKTMRKKYLLYTDFE
ncbi:exo-beta-N-acetylmuramidase NamZ family protein [Cytophaga sp.]|uniref:exo-beta-N-acetylmuramidase NamZ family protein n=1 Tax=Cytophaga sp. TaxID=29535 RepID=UPI003F7E4B2E